MKRMKRFNQSMLQGPLFPSIIAYTIPIILTSLLQLLFNAADLVVVGRYRGSLSVAAVSATGALINLIINLLDTLRLFFNISFTVFPFNFSVIIFSNIIFFSTVVQ